MPATRAHHTSGASRQSAIRHPATDSKQVSRLIVSLLAVMTAVALTHWPVLSAQALLLDDRQYIVDNPLVTNPGWDSAQRFFVEILQPSTVRGYYQPLTMLSLMLDHAAGGRADDLRVFHRTNLALHVINAGLLLLLLYALFNSLWAASLVSLLFGVHPLTVEAVAWVAERKTLLAATFALGALLAYVWHARRPVWPRLLFCTLLYLLAALAKPTALPLPLLLLVLDYWPLRRLRWQTLLEKLPLLALGGVLAAITIESQRRAAGLGGPAQGDPLALLLVVCHNLAFYLKAVFWPVNLTWHYPFPRELRTTQPLVLTGIVLAPLLIGLLIWSWRRTRALVVGILFFALALLPTQGMVGFTYVIAAHKFIYLPIVGLLLPLTALLVRLRNAGSRRGTLSAGATLAVVLLAALAAGITTRDLRRWRDSETLLRHMVAAAPDAHAMRYSLAALLQRRGETAAAEEQYRELLRREPDHWMGRNGLALLLWQQGRLEEAEKQLKEAVRLKRTFFEGYYNLGRLLAQQGRHGDAATWLRQAARLRPEDFDVQLRLGNSLVEDRQFDAALACYDVALRLRPTNALVHINRAVALAGLDRVAEAEAALRRALELEPENSAAREKLDTLLRWRAEQQSP